jgi:non-lysosomal glucosylceramidase
LLPWPSLKTYRRSFLDRLVLPVGGIGTGTVGFSGIGGWCDWEIMNVPAKGYTPASPGRLTRPVPSVLLRYREAGGPPQVRLLEGPIPVRAYEGAEGCAFPNAGIPRFADATFSTAYPFGEVTLWDRACPLRIRLQCYNPFIPGDVANSSWPVAFFRCIVENPTSKAIDCSVVFSLPNFIGADGSECRIHPHSGASVPVGYAKNRNQFFNDKEISGVYFLSEGVDPSHQAWGTMSLTTPSRSGISYRESWDNLGWGDAILEFYDDLLRDGRLQNHTVSNEAPMASLCLKRSVPPGKSVDFPFLLAWHFPNRLGWPPHMDEGDQRVGNHYTTCFRDARDVARKFWPCATQLESATRSFVETFLSADLPPPFKEGALFNLSTLRSQTCFRAADGRFFAWEGIFDRKGSCFGSCNHVWNYEQALGPLFPELAKSMHRTAFIEAMDRRGMMPFRITLNQSGRPFPYGAADGQTGHIVRVFREWVSGGDAGFLHDLWPRVRRALEFCWIKGGWDADRDGVMEGCQHNTMDVEYYGPNPQMQTWYLAALKAGEQMATHAGDLRFADTCAELHTHGRRWMETHLFNGEYFEQHIQRPDRIARGLCVQMDGGLHDAGLPDLQLGSGCLIDQLVGEWAARLSGLGRIIDSVQTRKTLRSILRFNQRKAAGEHFNHLRTYATGNEPALVMATFPRGRRPARPFPYFNEVMSGFEYVVAGHLLMEGMTREATTCVRHIRARYDGKKRNPYNEAECGHHYGRALASWAMVNAWSGFLYHAPRQSLTLSRPGNGFWATHGNWGSYALRKSARGSTLSLQVLSGQLHVQSITTPLGHWQGTSRLLSTLNPSRFELASHPEILQSDSHC